MSRHRRIPAVIVAAVAVVSSARAPAAAPDAVPLPRIETAGTLRFPDAAPTADGGTVAVEELSGVTWLGGDRFVAVMDTGVGFVAFALDLGADGAPRAIRDLRAVRLAARHDDEDVAPCPPAVARRYGADGPCLFVAEEDTPAIHVVTAGGAIAGTLPLPAAFATRRPNRGLEALCLAADTAALWTANEEAIPADGPSPTAGAGTVVRLVEVRLDAAADPAPGRQLAYAVDAPHTCVRVGAGEICSGVVALAALADGRLFVLERSATRGLPPFENRLYVVDPATAADVADVPRDLADRPAAHAAKRLCWRGALGCNVEGLAVGPPLAGGGTALVTVADSGGLDAPNHLIVLRMEPPVTNP